MEWLATQENAPPVALPEELRWSDERPAPQPRLTVAKSKDRWQRELDCKLKFQYGEHWAEFGTGPHAWYDRKTRRAVRRDVTAESAAKNQLLAAGAQHPRYYDFSSKQLFEVPPNKLSALVGQLAAAVGRSRPKVIWCGAPGALSFSVKGGMDWFELEGAATFEGQSAPLPSLLAALRRGESSSLLATARRGCSPRNG